MLQLIVFVPSSEPAQIINLLRTSVHSVVPTLNENGVKDFDKAINSILTVPPSSLPDV